MDACRAMSAVNSHRVEETAGVNAMQVTDRSRPYRLVDHMEQCAPDSDVHGSRHKQIG